MTATYTIDMTVELAQGGTIRFPDCLSIVGFHRAPNQHTLRALVHDTDADPSLNGRHVNLLLRVTTDTGITTEIADRIPVDVEPAPPQLVRLPPEPNEMISGTRYPRPVPGEPSQIEVGPSVFAAATWSPDPSQGHTIEPGRPAGPSYIEPPSAPLDVTPDPRLLTREKR